MHQTTFVWFVPKDDNRVEDGRDLRRTFQEEEGVSLSKNEVDLWHRVPCSFLEMLIALSRRLAFEAGGEPRWWFWHMMMNIGLEPLNDSMGHGLSERVMREVEVSDILERVISRTYSYNGDGGLFPLEEPDEDQRHVELWYQFQNYLIEDRYLR